VGPVGCEVKRPRSLKTHTDKIEVACGTMYVDISDDPNYQMFNPRLGKSGGCASGFLQLLGFWGTAALHAGYRMERLLEWAEEIQCPFGNDFKPSCAEGLRRVLEKNLKEKESDNNQPESA